MPYLTIERVAKSFPHRPRLRNLIGRERAGSTLALRGVDLAAEKGQLVALLGPNGSGKSTLLKILAGLLIADDGVINLAGEEMRSDHDVLRRKVGMAVSAERSFYPRLTASENLDFFAVLEDLPAEVRRTRIPWLLSATGLTFAADTLVMKFSTGMYQRLALARALLKEPELLLLDEPSRSLAPEGVAAFHDLLRSLKEKGTTILLATHSFEEAIAVGDRIAVLHEGAVALHKERSEVDEAGLRELYFAMLKKSEPQDVFA